MSLSSLWKEREASWGEVGLSDRFDGREKKGVRKIHQKDGEE